ncbi:bifunctional metallophosphatase/5'-nucleotidase [Luteolibacter luteus]|uniref:Bifunctional metallophosphatase/5'-nucleotidase n=1 Tax=Luteolibacter luteus TaxID=2728835 RepID=A0A858RJP8_9BACT|nr:bifunctional UDP-sugar hydrolase/5'-nucleotidase [Luteolibacter luteus]QJE97496.1 bifunctional metallophosphatase/5'-nucleotidase [Luteolibacter luteus]
MKDVCFSPISRRRFLAAGGAWLGAGLFADAAAERRGKTVSILHTTDLHGHILPTVTYDGLGDVGGLARCATQIRRWRKEFPDSLLVDIGDVYQGTAVGLNSGGKLMIELFNKLGYDAWVLGNHDFDWGREILEGALALSTPGVLTGNLRVDGKAAGDAAGVWQKVKPWAIREVGGFRIGLVGVITPGLPFWLTPKTLGGVEALNPVESLRRSVAEMKAEGVDAIVVLGHMGWRAQDDFANPIREMLGAVEGVDVYLAGHSHQDQPSWMTGRVLCSQANYYGIHCGRVDLTFDLESRKLIDRRAFTVLMDSRFDFDPLVIEVAKPELAKADEQMKRKVCTVKAEIPAVGVASLLCAAFATALQKNGTTVDGVFHGTFGRDPIEAGEKTVEDIWKILPYENGLVVADLTAAELVEIVAEDGGSRLLWPFEIELDGGKAKRFTLKGELVDGSKRYRVAFNTYDGQSGGRRLMKLNEILLRPESKRQEIDLGTRQALIDYLLDKGEI